MDPPAEIEILEGVASPTDDGNTPAADAVSMVLDNGDLLLEIMLRLGLPTTLVRSILVCRRWFSVASDPFLLHWFRRFHPPRLLGFYVATRSTTSHALLRPRFVTMPPPQEQEQEQELADAVRMAETYSLDAYEGDLTCISDLQNDTMLAAFYYSLTRTFSFLSGSTSVGSPGCLLLPLACPRCLRLWGSQVGRMMASLLLFSKLPRWGILSSLSSSSWDSVHSALILGAWCCVKCMRSHKRIKL